METVTLLEETHVVEPLGRCARRTSSQPGTEPITGEWMDSRTTTLAPERFAGHPVRTNPVQHYGGSPTACGREEWRHFGLSSDRCPDGPMRRRERDSRRPSPEHIAPAHDNRHTECDRDNPNRVTLWPTPAFYGAKLPRSGFCEARRSPWTKLRQFMEPTVHSQAKSLQSSCCR
jgi:hypothetical protein